MTRATLLATVALSVSGERPRPAVKPRTLKLRGGTLPPWPALYEAPGEPRSSSRTSLTRAGEVMEITTAGVGVVTLHAISFNKICGAIPEPIRFAFFLGVLFVENLCGHMSLLLVPIPLVHAHIQKMWDSKKSLREPLNWLPLLAYAAIPASFSSFRPF